MRLICQNTPKKNLPELGLIARNVLKLDYTPSETTIRRWKNAETELRAQAKTIKPISKHDRYRRKFEVKNVQRPETIRFADEIFDRFMVVLSNKCLSIQIMVDEARLYARENYPNLSLYGRPGQTLINKRYISDQCKRRGWAWKKIMGTKKVILPGVIENADIEIGAVIKDYSPSEVVNLDESRIMINFTGCYSIQPRNQELVPARKVNDLNTKASLTIVYKS